MLGKIVVGDTKEDIVDFVDPAKFNLVQEVSIKEPLVINPKGSPS